MNTPQLDVRYVANLARIELTDEEITAFQAQLGPVLEHVNQLARLNLDNVEPTAHAHPKFNVVRKDEPRPSLPKTEALANAPRQANGLFSVTKVIE
jgi:aspartyl-tRNA(Asn)/glutamyl-tRNA(Gln) amidotransferase subunit C